MGHLEFCGGLCFGFLNVSRANSERRLEGESCEGTKGGEDVPS